MRLTTFSKFLVSLVRAVRKDFTFSDGTVAPAGYTIGAPLMMLHNDAPDMTGLEEFDGFRYSRKNEESTGPTKHQMVNTDPNYVLFGHGKHAWYVE
jgi:cytochrome P450